MACGPAEIDAHALSDLYVLLIYSHRTINWLASSVGEFAFRSSFYY